MQVIERNATSKLALTDKFSHNKLQHHMKDYLIIFTKKTIQQFTGVSTKFVCILFIFI